MDESGGGERRASEGQRAEESDEATDKHRVRRAALRGAIWGYIVGFIILFLLGAVVVSAFCGLNPYAECQPFEPALFLGGIGALLPAGIGASIAAMVAWRRRRRITHAQQLE